MHVSAVPGGFPQSRVGQPMMPQQMQHMAQGPYGGMPGMPGMPPAYQPQAVSPTQLGHARPGQGSFQLQQRSPASSLGNFEALSPMSGQSLPARQALGGVPATAGAATAASPNREQALQKRVAELEDILKSKDQEIKELQSALKQAGIKIPAKKAQARPRDKVMGSGGFRKVSQSQPTQPYEAVDQEDPIDLRLEEFYNGTGSAIPFQRINRGFYRFGETILELNIINHKLMARTEDGWNRSKFGPIEKFIMYYENIEREKAGIPLES